MRMMMRWALCWVLCGLMAAPACAAAAEGWPGVRHVVIIGVDGLSGLGIEGADAPVMQGMMSRGAFTLRARAQLPTSSSTNWKAIISGAATEVHGVTSNDWERMDHSIRPMDRGPEGTYPTIFSRLRLQRSDATIAAVFHWGGFARLGEATSCDVYEHRTTTEATTDRAVEVIEQLRPTLLFVHLDHVDGAGHGAGWHTPAYFAAVEQADAMVGRILAALDRAGMRESTLVILTSDHGGIGRSHGGESMAELEIPWIASGPGIAAGRRLTAPVLTADTAATAAAALGITLAPSATGRAVLAARADRPDGPEVGVTGPYLGRPMLSPPQGRFVGQPGQVTLSTRATGVTLRYTTDGTEPKAASQVFGAPILVDRDLVLTAATFDASGARSELVRQTYRFVQPVVGRGASYHLFQGRFRTVAELYGATPVKSGVAPEIDFEDVKPPVESFGALFRATIDLDTPGEYRFWTESDDGSRLLVNGKTVVNNDGDHGPQLKSGSVKLEAGRHEIEVLYFNSAGSGCLRVFMAVPGGGRELLRHERLTPAGL